MNLIQRYRNFVNPPEPTALVLAAEELQSAQRELLQQAKLREYHNAMEEMLGRRVLRLQAVIRELSTHAEADHAETV